MGSGSWSLGDYSARAHVKAAMGKTTFDYHDTMAAFTPRSAWKVHETLDPAGLKMRESRDSVDHPASLAIAVLFDVTGSMLDIPKELQKRLPGLLGLLVRKGCVEHPQILFGAVGDATCDAVPFQIGQFESDNRIDECLESLVLEGGGGGQKTESYEIGLYCMARHTSVDCYEKRGKKGYLFLIGDEMAYPAVKRAEIAKLFGSAPQADIPVREILAEAQEKYETFFILPAHASHGRDRDVRDFWRGLLGQNVIELEDVDAVAETIGLTIGLCEGTTDLVSGAADLEELGSDVKSVRAATEALQAVAGTAAIVKAEPGALLPDLAPSSPTVRRL